VRAAEKFIVNPEVECFESPIMTSEVSPIQQANRDGAQRLRGRRGRLYSEYLIHRKAASAQSADAIVSRTSGLAAHAWKLRGGSQLQIGAVERTRTSTALRPTAPKAVASASSATTALAIFSHVLRLGSTV
jgi:hypothetical protein